MRSPRTYSKPFLWIVLALVLSGAVFAFPHSITDDTSARRSLTIVGTTNQCGTGGGGTAYTGYADEQGVFTGSAKYIASSKLPALIDLYSCKPDASYAIGCKPTYIGEYAAPYQFSGTNQQYFYEVYWCPALTNTCAAGDIMGVTETSYRVCANGQWGPETQCGALQYFDPAKKQCLNKLTTCQERWSCGAWGPCSNDGIQQRTCTDSNKCATFKYAPAAQQSCTPPASILTSGQIRDGIALDGQPVPDTYQAEPGKTITVTQKFIVKTPGTYWVEVGMEKYSGLSIASVNKNTCNPEETWYANAPVTFSTAGSVTQTFTLKAEEPGSYVLHSSTVTGCGGDTVQKETSSDRIAIKSAATENAGDTPSAVWAFLKTYWHWLLGVLVVIAGIIEYMVHWK